MLSIFSSIKRNEEIIRKCYLEILEREPEKEGFSCLRRKLRHLIRFRGVDKEKLKEALKNSNEYKKIELSKVHDRKPQYTFTGLYNIRYLIRPNSVLDDAIIRNGIFNKWLCLELKKRIEKNAIIFDIGANTGLLSLPFAKMCVPKGHVYAFEPDNHIVRHLKKNIKINKFGNITVRKLALQDNPKINKIILNINRAIQDNGLRNDGLSTIEKSSIYKIASEYVKTTTIDRFVEENQISRLDFIKIDTEGSEYRVLEGGEKTIIKFHPIIFYEYRPVIDKTTHFKNTEKSFKFIKKLGYKQYLKISSGKRNLVFIKDYSKNLSDGDMLCFF